MPRTLDSRTRDALAERLKFYRDLGLTEFYRRDVEPAAAVDDPKLGRSVAEELAERDGLLQAAIEAAAQSAAEPSVAAGKLLSKRNPPSKLAKLILRRRNRRRPSRAEERAAAFASDS